MIGSIRRFAENTAFLIVEDDAVIVMMIEMMLHDGGARNVAIAGSVAEATALVENGLFDVAIFDRTLPDGISYPAAILAGERGAKIIIASGAPATDLPDALRTAILVPKPFDLSQLGQAVTEALAQR